MKVQKRHNFDFNSKNLKMIDQLLPKLKFSIMPSKLVRWLENFEESDYEMAYDFLQILEYINFTELQYRIEEQLKRILSKLGENDKILIYPYGKFGKSSSLITYPLTHSETYEKLQNEDRVFIEKDLESFEKTVNCIVFLDDFVGTGETFCNKYVSSGCRSWCDGLKISNRFVLAAVAMEKGVENIETTFPNITVYAQIRNKIFKNNGTPLELFGSLFKYETFNDKYESIISVSNHLKKGYRDSQSLIAFSHCVPDNTLPVVWWSKNWFPLYPRENMLRMDEAREFKKSIAFYIGICNRLKVDLLKLKEYKGKLKSLKFEDRWRYNNKMSHSIIALLKLKKLGYQDLIISHILGLTDSELNVIYDRAKELNFINELNSLSIKATKYLEKLERTIRREKFREESEQNLQLKNKDLLYVPNTFNGWT